jgi:hypothetical protein
MTMTSAAADLVRQVQARLSRQLGISAVLADVAAAAEAEADPRDAAKTARRLLPDRIHSLADAVTELQGLADALKHLQKILPYTAEGWPGERERLRGLLAADPASGVAAWLLYWYQAASYRHLDVLNWLAAEVPLPAGAELLTDRAAAAASGLSQGSWDLAAPMLSAGLAGVRVGPAEVHLSGSVQRSLRLLLARLALRAGRLDDAEQILRTAREAEASAAVMALDARRCRKAGDLATARSLLAGAQDADPGDLDVVTELIAQIDQPEHAEPALDLARVGVDGLTTLLDVDSAVGRLVEPPSELWLAIADRAAREDNSALVAKALDHAERLTSSDVLLAGIAERRAGQAGPGEARQRHLLDSGDRNVNAGRLDRARLDYQRVVDEQGDSEEMTRLRAQARIRNADCIAAQTSVLPLRAVRDEVTEALEELLEARQVADLAAAESWNFMIEAGLRLNLARGANPDRSGQLWQAFLAAARAVAFVPGEARRWDLLGQAGRELCCYAVADVATSQSQQLGGQPEISSRIDALLAGGRNQDVIDLLGDANDAWSECVRCYALLRQGEADAAVRLLRAVTIDPQWLFARNALVSALLLTGDCTEGVARAAELAGDLAERTDEMDSLAVHTQMAMVTGDFSAALTAARRLLLVEQETGLFRGDAGVGVGQALTLLGEQGDGLAYIADSLALYDRLGSLDYWSLVDRPVFATIAGLYGVGLDPAALDELEPIVAARKRELIEPRDPDAELAAAEAGTADPSVVSSAVALGTAILRLAGGQIAGVSELVATIGAEYPQESDAVAAQLRDLVNRSDREEVAAEAPQESQEQDVPIRLALPESWFAGHPDPVRDHELFLRYLPEVRLRSTELPPVRVSIESQLEPGGYTVSIGGQVLAAGLVSPAERYCQDSAFSFLPAELRSVAAPDSALGMQQLPAGSVASAGPLAELLTMPAVEVVARIAADAGQRAAANAPGALLQAAPAAAPGQQLRS